MTVKEIHQQAAMLAQRLAKAEVDRNELGSMEAFLQNTSDVETFWKLLNALPASGLAQRSKQTPYYFRTIRDALIGSQKDRSLSDLRQIIAWTRRLLAFHDEMVSPKPRKDRGPGRGARR